MVYLGNGVFLERLAISKRAFRGSVEFSLPSIPLNSFLSWSICGQRSSMAVRSKRRVLAFDLSATICYVFPIHKCKEETVTDQLCALFRDLSKQCGFVSQGVAVSFSALQCVVTWPDYRPLSKKKTSKIRLFWTSPRAPHKYLLCFQLEKRVRRVIAKIVPCISISILWDRRHTCDCSTPQHKATR